MKNLINTQGKTLRFLDEQESLLIRREWISAFCQNKEGIDIKSYLWHIFSSGMHVSLDGKAARTEYPKHIAAQYYVMPNAIEPIILVDALPLSCNRSDYYVFPLNMAWTMAFTHEDGWLGPYFAKRNNYKDLNTINEQYREKRNQIEIAKKNRWC